MRLSALIKGGPLRGFATATPATPATPAKHGVLEAGNVATVETVAVANAAEGAANDPATDFDRWCWPHTGAMATGEIDTFTVRLAHFTDKGMGLEVAEMIAYKLVIRDREGDEQRLCLECANLTRAGGWRCSQWKRAAIGSAAIPADLVQLLQRCDGFKTAISNQYRPRPR